MDAVKMNAGYSASEELDFALCLLEQALDFLYDDMKEIDGIKYPAQRLAHSIMKFLGDYEETLAAITEENE